ncbi:MAG: rotamase, partial [Bdellovibrionales bacterium]
EQLKLQEANALDMEISQEEVEEGFARIAGQNNIPADQFKQMLLKSGINMNTLYDQIRSEIAWGRVVAARIRPRV